MQRITEADIEGMLRRVTCAMDNMDIDTEGMYVQAGSKLNGIAFRLYRTVGDSGGVGGVIMPDGFLGTTRREAYDTLHAIAQSLEFVNSHH